MSLRKSNVVPKVSVITLNWNGLQDTLECVDSLLRDPYENLEIVVVDNGSGGGDADALCSRYGESVRVLRNQRNYGYAGGLIRGMKDMLARGVDYILIVQNDMVIEPGMIALLCNAVSADPGLAVVVPSTMRYDDPERFDTSPELAKCLGLRTIKLSGVEPKAAVMDCHWAQVGCMLLTRRYVEECDLFRAVQPYFLYGDVMWYLPAFRNRLRIGYVPAARVWHKGSLSLKRMGPSRMRWAMRDYAILWWRFWRRGYYRGLEPAVLGMYVYWIFIRRPLDLPVMVARNLRWETFRSLTQGALDAARSLLGKGHGGVAAGPH